MSEAQQQEKQKVPRWLLLLWLAFLVFIVTYVILNL